MADHLAAIGIGSSSEEERRDQVRRILKEARPHAKKGDSMTLRWTDASGAELWIYVDSTGAMKSVQPHFAGGARMNLELQSIVERPEVSPFDGGFLGLTSRGGSNPALGGGFPVIFDAPDFPAVRDAFVTAKHDVELAAFALELSVYTSEEEFREAQPDLKALEVPSFIPAGMMAEMEGGSPTAHALMVGKITEAQTVRNELTEQDFRRLRIETPAGPMDMVVDPGLTDAPLEKGNIVQAGAWLSGRLAPEDDEK